ncbi:hypothetical protein ACWCXB_32365 [Streptomyces sp. NPDC001514]
MIWWLRARGAVGLLATVCLTMLGGLLAGEAELPIPVLTGQSGTFLVGHLLTVLPAVMLMYGMGRTDTGIESVACRTMPGWDATLGLATAAAGATAAGLLHLISANDITFVLGRNLTGYIGCALLLTAFLGPRIAAVLTTALPLLCAATGWQRGGQPERWAWILQPAQSSAAAATAVGLLIVGAAFASAQKHGALARLRRRFWSS